MPTPVKFGQTPHWLKQRIRKRMGHGYDIYDAANRNGGWPWFDHWGTTKLHNGDEAFVTEPYGLTTESIRGVLQFADVFGLNVEISEDSYYRPVGGTIRVAFTPNGPEPPAGRWQPWASGQEAAKPC